MSPQCCDATGSIGTPPSHGGFEMILPISSTKTKTVLTLDKKEQMFHKTAVPPRAL